ncbi:MAG TPA: ACP S-malonyltransferase [Solirubrobacteraceae bacterium]
MERIAVLFPGQGSHAEGMETGLRGTPALERGLELLGFDPFARLDEGTRFQQPALFLCSVAAWERERPEGVIAAAGHSLGEYAALVAAEALAFEDALNVVRVRGEAMAAAPPGGMTALLGGDEEAVRALAAELGLTVANDNAPGQLVLSGAIDALAEAEARTDARARRLDVSGAFHSPLMASAADALHDALAAVEVRTPRFPVYSNGTAHPFFDVRDELVANLLRPVRWRETVLALRETGAEDFVELGPGRVLTGLVKRTLRQVAA